MRRLFVIPLLILVFTFGFSIGVVEATDGMRGNRCVVAKEDYIDHDFYFFCRSLTIHGTIDGDLIGIASDVTITREAVVTGDVWVMGGQLTISGSIGDDVHFAGADLEVTERAVFTSSRVDIAGLALNLEITENVEVPGDILMFGYQAILEGNVGGNIDFQGQNLTIDGDVAGNVDAIVGDSRVEISLRSIPFLPYSVRLRDYGLYVGDSAQIGGNLNYEAAQQSNIPRNAVQGKVDYTQVLAQADITRAQQPRTFFSILQNYLLAVLRDVISLVLVGMLALQFTPVLIVEPSIRVRQSLLPAVSWGLILFILFFPITLMSIIMSIIVVVLITFITLSSLTWAAALLVTIVNLSFILSFLFVFIYLGRAITCFLIGYSLIQGTRFYFAKRQHDPDDPPIYIPPVPLRYRWTLLMLGAVIYSLIVNVPLPSPIPTLALVFEAIVALSGLGAIFMLGRDRWYLSEARRSTTPRIYHMDTDFLEESDMPLGMNNLPEGFEGFNDD